MRTNNSLIEPQAASALADHSAKAAEHEEGSDGCRQGGSMHGSSMPRTQLQSLCHTTVPAGILSCFLSQSAAMQQDLCYGSCGQGKTGPFLVAGLPRYKGISGQLLAGLPPAGLFQKATEIFKASASSHAG